MQEAEKKNPKEQATLEALKEIQAVLKKHDIRYWLDCGGLLGLIREGGLLSWDTDVDLFSLKRDVTRETVIRACKDLEAREFEVCHFWEKQTITTRKKGCLHMNLHFLDIEDEFSYYTQYKSYEIKGKLLSMLWWLTTAARYGYDERSKLIVSSFTKIIRRRGGELQDSGVPAIVFKLPLALLVNFLRLIPSKEKFTNYLWDRSKKYCKVIKWKFPLKNYERLKIVPFYDTSIPIPYNEKEHLEFYFGKDWRVPKKGDDWDETRDNPTVTAGVSEYNLPKGRK
jgi:phosphorylcholine metabolism protein LicD